METRARPTSRGRARCVSVRMGRRWEQTAAGPRAGACRLRRGRWATLPCPGGQGALRGCAFDAVCPEGKGAAEWRAGSWRVAEKNRVSERFAHQGTLPARRGTGERTSPQGAEFSRTPSTARLTMSLSPQETEIRAISQSERTLPLAKSSTFIHPWQTRPFTSRAHDSLSRRTSSARPSPASRAFSRSSAPAKGHLSALPAAASSPGHPAGRTAGSARTRSRVQLRLSLQVQQKGKDRTSQGPVLEWR